MTNSRKNLVIVRAGANSLHREWLKGAEPRSWDLQLSQYDDDPGIADDGDLPLSRDKGTKWDSIFRYFQAAPEMLDRYKYIMLMDDDVLFTGDDINRFLEITEAENLAVAQPSLHKNSYCCYPILLHCAGMRLRFTNFVEGMAPALRADHLRSVLEWMSRFHSGWGIDRLWAVSMKDPSFRAGIVDAVQVLHTRPHGTGKVYTDFRNNNVDPLADMERLLKGYRNVPNRMLVYGGITASGRRIGSTSAQLTNGTHLLTHAMSYRVKRDALRTGAGMLVRSVSAAGYRPRAIHATDALPAG